ncbi:P-loop containing nucleoside triphosphate hydrolase protein, partial [Pelagophyceae sp. CCMP2097]
EQAAEEPREDSFEIEFEDVRLTLPNGVEIMRGVTGKISPGRSTAIMGASGAGKTTLMNLITGKVQRTAGVVKVNGQTCDSLDQWKSRIAFVPQEDIMHRRLTVLQNVAFSASLRLPADWTKAQRHAKVNKTLISLNLDHVRHTIIGDEFERGVSGGQRKRVNVALEVVSDPKVLFLDEPTSGLDSVSATELARMLAQMARESAMTICAVIHSPGPAAFQAFDDLILLQTGGRPVYLGA